ncbi:MAG: archaellin/type IV pilin N-terminal domain-containing protein [Nitrososphaerales archaeon]
MSELKTFKNKTSKARKAISPVIATVILVAVAVVIAAALAGFSSSLFGSYSSAGAAVTVKSLTVLHTGSGSVTLVNSGNIADELVSMQVVGHVVLTDGAGISAGPISTDLSIPGNNGEMDATFTDLADTNSDPLAEFKEGQNITVKMSLKSGIQLTQSVIVIAA